MFWLLISTVFVMAGLFFRLARLARLRFESPSYVASLVTLRILTFLFAVGGSWLSFGLFMGEFLAPIWLIYATSAFFVGAWVPRAWYLAIAIAWLPVALAPEFIAGLATGVSLDALMFGLSPFAALIGGYLGSWSARRWLTPNGSSRSAMNASDVPGALG